MGLNLLAFAHGRQAGMEHREQEDRINDFGRKPIGDSLQEQVGQVKSRQQMAIADRVRFSHCQKYNEQVRDHLSRKQDDMPKLETHKKEDDGKGGGKPKWKLEEVERWSMIKRIF